MDFFALTSYGFSSPIKDMIRPDYIEPQAPPKNPLDAETKIKQTLSERIKELDCYLGHADGYSYRSYERLSKSRRKYVIKPDGPIDMYNYPGTTLMQIGWWVTDPILKESDWQKTREFHPRPNSDLSRYIEICMKKDKAFKPSS
ncbi:uncharacterized protein LOC130893406 [Diorhabda carinulata]|uniref:uncharacterized protein LOC130893406 n=1 Tax=Diorhabda carinulata TaxID=1163345 RepID=UPI0025A1930B|nr:uncharacterized protein LOC130893406 [Diorhabda carinulata]